MTLKAKMIASCVIAMMVGTGAYYQQVQRQARAENNRLIPQPSAGTPIGKAAPPIAPKSLQAEFMDYVTSSALLAKCYQGGEDTNMSIQGTVLSVKYYERRKETPYSDIQYIYALQHRNQVTWVPVRQAVWTDCRRAKMREPLLYIPSPGGNAANSMHADVFLVLPNSLSWLGRVGLVEDKDSDGFDDLIIYDDTFEQNSFLSHAGSPTIPIPMRLKNNKMVPDLSDLPDRAKKANAIISSAEKGDASHNADEVLSAILEKLLVYRLLGKIEEGWPQFIKDIRRKNQQGVWICNNLTPMGEKATPESIEAEAKSKLPQSLVFEEFSSRWPVRPMIVPAN